MNKFKIKMNRSEIYEAISKIEDLKEKILYLQKQYESLPQQGSVEWLKGRRIGASMAAGVLGLSKYENAVSVANQMLGLSRVEKTIQMMWGNIFEPATKLWLSNFIYIYEFPSLPGFGFGGEIYTSCSPDGVFIMTSDFALKHINNANAFIDKIMLLEIKCPYMRVIKEDMPDYYLPQLYVGMETIPICEGSSFCEFGIRICSLQDFNFTGSCRTDKQRSIGGMPFAIGLIFAYSEGITANEPITVKDIEVPDFEGSLLDKFHATWLFIDKNYTTCIEPERFRIFLRKFGDENYMSICKFFRRIVPKWDYIDFGAVNNYNSKWVRNFDKDLLAIKDFRYIKPIDWNFQTDWECKEYLCEQLEKVDKNGLLGVIPYKIYTAQVQYVAKKNYRDEIKKLCIFGKNIEAIKKMPEERWPLYVQSFCKMFNESVMGVVPSNEGIVKDT